VSLPDPLVAQVDDLIAGGGYAGRSDVVRAALRHLIATLAAQGGGGRGPRTATVTAVYEENSRRVLELRHAHARIIRSAIHSHGGGNCVEVFLVEGPAAAVRQFTDELRGLRDTLMVHVAYTDTIGAHDPAH